MIIAVMRVILHNVSRIHLKPLFFRGFCVIDSNDGDCCDDAMAAMRAR